MQCSRTIRPPISQWLALQEVRKGFWSLNGKAGGYQLNWKPFSKAIVDDLCDFVMVCARTGKCPGIDPQRLPPGLLHQQSITVDR
jgi:hypothetical protein